LIFFIEFSKFKSKGSNWLENLKLARNFQFISKFCIWLQILISICYYRLEIHKLAIFLIGRKMSNCCEIFKLVRNFQIGPKFSNWSEIFKFVPKFSNWSEISKLVRNFQICPKLLNRSDIYKLIPNFQISEISKL